MTITDLPTAWWIVGATILSAVVGSFLNVVVHRLPRMLERRWQEEARAYLSETTGSRDDAPPQPNPYHLAYPPSHCPQCGTTIRWYDNLPILSWLLLRGRCRTCKGAIPWRYLLVELATALLGGWAIAHFGPTVKGGAALLFLWVVIALAAIDWETQLLPDDLTLPLLWLGLLVNLNGYFAPLNQAVIGAVVGYLSLYTLYVIFKWLTGKEGMGYGDFKLLAALGAWFGVGALPEIVLASSLIGATVGILARLTGRLAQGQPIPFGPFLALGGLCALFFPGQITTLVVGHISL